VLEFRITDGVRLTDVIDVALVAVLLWATLSWLRRARARIALAGVGIAAAAFLIARQLELQMTVWILQGFFAVLVIVLVVVFQEDLRRLFEQIAIFGLRRKPVSAPPDAVDALVEQLLGVRLARTGPGAWAVTGVRNGSGAAQIGVQTGDLLLAINGRALLDDAALRRSVAGLRGENRALIVVQRGNGRYHVTIPLG